MVGYIRRPQPKNNKLAPRGSKCIMLGVAANHPQDTFRICDLSMGHIVERQAISWHPPAGHGTDGFITVAPGMEESKCLSPKLKGPSNTSQRWEAWKLSRRRMSWGGQTSRGRVGGRKTQRRTFRTRGEPEENYPDEVESEGEQPEDEESAQGAPGADQSDQERPATQEVSAAVQKNYNSLTGTPHPTSQSRKRSGRYGRKNSSPAAFCGAAYRKKKTPGPHKRGRRQSP